jgi:alkane 1-monooxygenase
MPPMDLARGSDVRFLLGVLFPALTLASVSLHPERAALGAFGIWALIALSEALVPAFRRSPGPTATPGWLAWVPRFFVPLEFLLVAAGLAVAAQADWATVLGVALTTGFVTGAQGISFAHELGHSRKRADRALGWVLMTMVNYGHFMVEHYRGHHVRAATWDDPASARPGESLWRFLPRTLAGSWRNAWKLEAGRLRTHGQGWFRSPLAWSSAVNLAVLAALLASGQWKMLAFWTVQSAFAVWLLETVNYIEHYGLQRRTGPDGRMEPFGVQHAWNTDTVLGNSLLLNLQRHSDHHLHLWKPYASLEASPAPRLPTGYAGCLLLASIPPVWFALMHRRMAGVGRKPA